MTAAVDVLIPAYNAAKTIRETIASVQAQTFADWRAVIVNDGSTDATGDILAELAAQDPRIEIHTQANAGIVDTLNTGLQLCRADIIARLDADDICYPNRFQWQHDFLREYPNVVGVGAGVRHVREDGTPTGTVAELGQPELADPWFAPSKEPYVIHPFVTYRRQAVLAIGGYRHVHYAEDTDLYWRLLGQGRLVNPRYTFLGDYRMHAGSVSSTGIINGRIMAINSQRCGVSEQRRRERRPDLTFPKETLAELRAARTLSAMVPIGAREMDATERRYYEIAVAVKLLELTSYRPYEVDSGDCEFIGAVARRGYGFLPSVNRGLIQRRVAGTAARLAAEGRMADARRLLPPRMYPSFAPRYAIRSTMPMGVRRFLRRNDTKSAPFK